MAHSSSVSSSARSAAPRVDPAYAAAAAPSGPLAQGREFVWTNADFARVQALIYQRAGISLHDGKHAMVYSRLSRRLRDTGHTSFHDYLGWLETHDGPEWQEFVNALTTNLTAFFREQHHFEIFASHLRAKPTANWRVWCNAASTGEEPYSIVMTESAIDNSCILGLGSVGERMLILLDIEKLMSSLDMGLVTANE